jgi:FlaA1/EpsC-like NDP-sugar epimerase
MTRFNISLQAGVDLVMFAIKNHLGGEIFIPKIPSYKIIDVAKSIGIERIVIGKTINKKHNRVVFMIYNFNI